MLQKQMGCSAHPYPSGPPRAGISRKRVVQTRAGQEPQGPREIQQKQQYLKHISRGPPVSGSERGEAFFTLSPSSPLLDVDSLNEQLRPTGAARLRNVQQPDQAYGLIFNLDNVIANTRAALAKAWKDLSVAKGLPCPEDTLRLVRYGSCPERIMMDVLRWSRDPKVVRALCWDLAEAYGAALMEQTTPTAPGLREWLDSAATYSVPCAAVSTLDRPTARRLLEKMHLHDHFVHLQSADEMCTTAQSFLSSALQLQRPPNHCVVFDDCPLSITAAHNASMKIVGIRSKEQPAYRCVRGNEVTCGSNNCYV
uniref:Uncharacterized protein n=1 Tax=Dunaliella tertiolecta TaxID=3047 RepID=A0A7S3VQ14_DUNTE